MPTTRQEDPEKRENDDRLARRLGTLVVPPPTPRRRSDCLCRARTNRPPHNQRCGPSRVPRTAGRGRGVCLAPDDLIDACSHEQTVRLPREREGRRTVARAHAPWGARIPADAVAAGRRRSRAQWNTPPPQARGAPVLGPCTKAPRVLSGGVSAIDDARRAAAAAAFQKFCHRPMCGPRPLRLAASGAPATRSATGDPDSLVGCPAPGIVQACRCIPLAGGAARRLLRGAHGCHDLPAATAGTALHPARSFLVRGRGLPPRAHTVQPPRDIVF